MCFTCFKQHVLTIVNPIAIPVHWYMLYNINYHTLLIYLIIVLNGAVCLQLPIHVG